MVEHSAELVATHVNVGCAMEEWAQLKEQIITHVATVHMTKMLESLVAKREHVPWAIVWCVLALLWTYQPA